MKNTVVKKGYTWSSLAGDHYIAARLVGGDCTISKCDRKDKCYYESVIPANRVADYNCIIKERAVL